MKERPILFSDSMVRRSIFMDKKSLGMGDRIQEDMKMKKPKKKSVKISLTMSRDQAIVLMRACEIFSRCGMMQFMDLIDILRPDIDVDEASAIDNLLKEKLSGYSVTYYGIGNCKCPEECKIAWDAYQHLRREISWHDKGMDWRKDKRVWDGEKSMWGVCYYDPMKTAQTEGVFETEIKE